jgi:hypothetical protein
MGSIIIGLVLLSLISGDALVISGGNLAHIDTASGTVTASVGVLGTWPNSIVIHEGYGFVVNSGTDTQTLQRFETGTWSLAELGIGTGWNCWSALPLSNGMLAVSAALNNSVVMVDPLLMEIVHTVEGTGPSPEWMAEEDGLLYVACGGWGTGTSVVVVDIAAGTPVDTLEAGTNVQSVVTDGSGRLFAVCSNTYGSNGGFVAVIDIDSGETIETLETGGFPGYSASAGGILYTSDPWAGGVFAIDMENLTVLHDWSDPFCTGGDGLAADELGYLWVSDAMTDQVRVYDPFMNLVETYAVPSAGPLAVNGSYMGVFKEPFENAIGITVSPIPASVSVTVRTASSGGAVRIFDMAGRAVAESQSSQEGKAFFCLDGFRPGLYTAVCGGSAVRFPVTAR